MDAQIMTLGEFRELTKDMPDDACIVPVQIVSAKPTTVNVTVGPLRNLDPALVGCATGRHVAAALGI